MRTLLFAAASLSAAMSLSPAAAQGPAAGTITCPVGGEKFEYGGAGAAPAAASGTRPDGKPYGVARAPIALPECPGNGLILYKDYSVEDVAKLTKLIASEPYLALRKADTPYYRTYWLMMQMGEDKRAALFALLQAGWEADGKPDLRRRYLAELAEEAAKMPARPNDLNWVGMEARAVNALRELGRFDEARARLAKLPVAALNVPVPAAGTPEQIQQARARRGWSQFLQQLSGAIQRKDASAEPLELIPRRVALERCADTAAALSAPQKAFCESDEMKSAAAQLRGKPPTELDALRRSREESGR
jgi:hypothetical protein